MKSNIIKLLIIVLLTSFGLNLVLLYKLEVRASPAKDIIPVKSVTSFGPLKLGAISPVLPGHPTITPYKHVPDNAKFYVYVMQKDFGICAYAYCGMNGVIVECMDGWLSNIWEQDADMVGLDYNEVKQGKTSLVLVANKDSRLIGIYPNHDVRDLPAILRTHRNLSDTTDECLYAHMSNF